MSDHTNKSAVDASDIWSIYDSLIFTLKSKKAAQGRTRVIEVRAGAFKHEQNILVWMKMNYLNMVV